ncbi:unnamed protein product, partial [Candidula unifasciata]
MALQFRQPPSYQMHMFSTARDNTFSARDNNHSNRGCINMLPNISGFNDLCMTNKSDLDDVRASTLTDWTRKRPQGWTKKDVLDWIYYLVEQEQLDGSKFKGEAYRDLAGCDLCVMSKDQFLKVDPCHGNIIYDSFQCLLRQESVKNEMCRLNGGHNVPVMFNKNFTTQCRIDENNNINTNEEGYLGRQVTDICDNSHTCYTPDLTVLRSDNDIKVDLPSLGVYPISQVFELPFTEYDCSTLPFQSSTSLKQHSGVSQPINSPTMPTMTPWSVSSAEDSVTAARAFLKLEGLFPSATFPNTITPSTNTSSRSADFRMLQGFPSVSTTSTNLSRSTPCSLPGNVQKLTTDSIDLEYSSDDSSCSLSFMPPMGSPKCGDAFCSDNIVKGINDSSTQQRRLNENTVQREGRRVRTAVAAKAGNQLWKFLLELLRDPEANPRLLKWEDRN